MKGNRAVASLSRRGGALLFVMCLLVLAAGCDTTQSEELRKLQAKNSYENAVRNLTANRLALGMAALKEAIQLDPQNAQFHNTLGLVYLNLGRPIDGQAEIEEAIAAYKKAISFPTYSTPEVAYYNMGEAFIRLRKPQEAVESFRAAIQLEPTMVAAHYGLGLALSQAGKPDEAKAAFRQARDLDPASPFSELAKNALKQLGEGG